MEEPRPDHHDQQQEVVATEPSPVPPSLINPAPAEQKLPNVRAPDDQEEEEAVGEDESSNQLDLDQYGLNRNSKYYDQMVACLWKPGAKLWFFDDDEDEEEQEITRRETTIIAKEALNSYNEKNEGVKYVFVEPGDSSKMLFHLAIVTHLNFTAREDNNPSPPRRFFAETVKYYGGMFRVHNCVNLEGFAPDQVHKVCLYCYRKDIEHPPNENCEFGRSRFDDEKKFDYETAEDEETMTNHSSATLAKAEADFPLPLLPIPQDGGLK